MTDSDVEGLMETLRADPDMYVPEEIAFVDDLPLTDIGKTDKKALRATLTD